MAKGRYQEWLTEDGLTLLAAWARDGLTFEQIAHNCGCSLSTLFEWKKRYPEISEVLKKGRAVVDVQVENALLKRALGYSYDEVMVEQSEDGCKKRVTTKFIPADTTAQIFWLKNRRPDLWRDRAQGENKDALERLDKLIEGISHAAQS